MSTALTRRAVAAMESGERWLTPAAKAAIVEEWLATREKPIPPNAGGQGYPDPAIFGWTDAINAIADACTLQSCSGHLSTWTDADGEHTFRYPGELWIWLTEKAARSAYERLPQLMVLPDIELVRILMVGKVATQEVLDIQFAGAGLHADFPLAPVVNWLAAL